MIFRAALPFLVLPGFSAQKNYFYKVKFLRAIGKWTLVLVFSCIAALLMFELIYRYQWFDFYATELKGLNTEQDLSGKKNILVGGDSYSASPDSYVKTLRGNLPGWSVINSSSPGTGIVQASYVLPGRIETYKPEIFIYQVYTGNDLLDISHPSGSDAIGFWRGTYWWLSDRLRSLAYLNYKMGGAAAQPVNDLGQTLAPSVNDTFSADRYTNREKLQFLAEPALLDNSLYLLNGRNEDMNELCEKLKAITGQLPDSCKVFIVIVPHAAQVSENYYRQMQQLGASFQKPLYRENTFPFTQKLRESFPSATIIDPLPLFRGQEANGTHLYYANDPHLAPQGQKILGDYICGFVRAEISR